MKLYFWPYVHDEYFWSFQFFAIANSLEEAKQTVREKLEKDWLEPKKKIESSYELREDNYKSIIDRCLNQEPKIYNIEINTSDYSETWR